MLGLAAWNGSKISTLRTNWWPQLASAFANCFRIRVGRGCRPTLGFNVSAGPGAGLQHVLPTVIPTCGFPQLVCVIKSDRLWAMADGGLMTLDEAAAYLGVAKITLRRWTRDGQLTCVRIGRG